VARPGGGLLQWKGGGGGCGVQVGKNINEHLIGAVFIGGGKGGGAKYIGRGRAGNLLLPIQGERLAESGWEDPTCVSLMVRGGVDGELKTWGGG